jgi:rubrerythrin
MGRLSPGEEELQYYEKARELDPENIETRYCILKNRISNCTVEGREAVVREALTTEDGLHPDLLEPILELVIDDYKAEVDGDLSSIFTTFNAVISGASLIPECWPELLQCMDKAIEDAESESRPEDLAILHLHKGIAASLCGEEYKSTRSEVEHWQECWTLAKENNSVRTANSATTLLIGENSDPRSLASLLLIIVGNILSQYHFDQTRLLPDGDEQSYQNQVKELERIAMDQSPDGLSGWTRAKCYLASQYVLRGQVAQAQALFRWDMAVVFNILTDDDFGNDWVGYSKLAHLLTHVGDYENAGVAYKLIPSAFLNQEILAELLNIGDEAAAAAATKGITDFYASNCSEGETPLTQVIALQSEVARLSEQATEEESQHWKELARILKEFNDVLMLEWFIQCDGCGVRCGFDETFWACGFCFCTHFCESCHQKLYLKEKTAQRRPKLLVCSETHDWFRLPVWDAKRFAWACRGRVPAIEKDGQIVISAEGEAIPVRRWLGYLCGKWELNKEDWGFE